MIRNMDRTYNIVQVFAIVIFLQRCIQAQSTGCTASDLEYMCADNTCIPMSALCNGVKDCKDGSDEVGCNEQSKEHQKQDICERSCYSGQCYKRSERCDGKYHCDDKSDEERCETLGSSQSSITTGGIIGISLASSMVLVIVMAAAGYVFYYKHKIGHLPSLQRGGNRRHEEEYAATGLPYIIPRAALVREPPPRYTSQGDLADLSIVNPSFTLEEGGFQTRPPPIYSSRQSLVFNNLMVPLEAPPAYSSSVNLDIPDANVDLDSRDMNSVYSYDNNVTNDNVGSASDVCELNVSVDVHNISRSHYYHNQILQLRENVDLRNGSSQAQNNLDLDIPTCHQNGQTEPHQNVKQTTKPSRNKYVKVKPRGKMSSQKSNRSNIKSQKGEKVASIKGVETTDDVFYNIPRHSPDTEKAFSQFTLRENELGLSTDSIDSDDVEVAQINYGIMDLAGISNSPIAGNADVSSALHLYSVHSKTPNKPKKFRNTPHIKSNGDLLKCKSDDFLHVMNENENNLAVTKTTSKSLEILNDSEKYGNNIFSESFMC